MLEYKVNGRNAMILWYHIHMFDMSALCEITQVRKSIIQTTCRECAYLWRSVFIQFAMHQS